MIYPSHAVAVFAGPDFAQSTDLFKIEHLWQVVTWPICCRAGGSRCWQWLQNDCSLSVVVNTIITAIYASKWQSWLVGNKVGVLNQLVARCVLRLPVRRSAAVVPDSSGGLVGVTWKDL